jgi:hypothetical protein
VLNNTNVKTDNFGKKGRTEVKTISAFTCDLQEIVEYLKSNGVTTAAMEST